MSTAERNVKVLCALSHESQKENRCYMYVSQAKSTFKTLCVCVCVTSYAMLNKVKRKGGGRQEKVAELDLSS